MREYKQVQVFESKESKIICDHCKKEQDILWYETNYLTITASHYDYPDWDLNKETYDFCSSDCFKKHAEKIYDDFEEFKSAEIAGFPIKYFGELFLNMGPKQENNFII